MNENNKVNLEIAVLKEAAALIPQVKKAIQKFDGKVFNCRFAKHLKEVFPDVSIFVEHKQGYGGQKVGIYVYPKIDNVIQYSNQTYICWCDLPDNKRIDLSAFEKSLNEHYSELLKNAAHLEELKEKAPVIKKQIEALHKTLSALYAGISWHDCELFNIKTSFHR